MSRTINERVFEFCYNAEYCNKNSAIIAALPEIPSQREEKYCGWDVKLTIREGKSKKSLFLQHKAPHFATRLAGKNRRFYSIYNAPYFRFKIDNEQHNLLHDLDISVGNTYYCAPLFHEHKTLQDHFWAGSVCANSVLLKPQEVGPVAKNKDNHNITYDVNGQKPTLHSEPKPFQRSYRAGPESNLQLHNQTVDEEYVEKLNSIVMRNLDKEYFRLYVKNKEFQSMDTLEQTQMLLSKHYKVSWIIIP